LTGGRSVLDRRQTTAAGDRPRRFGGRRGPRRGHRPTRGCGRAAPRAHRRLPGVSAPRAGRAARAPARRRRRRAPGRAPRQASLIGQAQLLGPGACGVDGLGPSRRGLSGLVGILGRLLTVVPRGETVRRRRRSPRDRGGRRSQRGRTRTARRPAGPLRSPKCAGLRDSDRGRGISPQRGQGGVS